MKVVLLVLVGALCCVVAQHGTEDEVVEATAGGGKEFPPEIIKQIIARTKNMTRAVDWRYCVPTPREQIGPSCHTFSFGLQYMSSLCLAQNPDPATAKPIELSYADFFSCKTQTGMQHIDVVGYWNQNGGFSVEQDQKWNYKTAKLCQKEWSAGLGGRNRGPHPQCNCRRLNNTRNPLGHLDPSNCTVQPGSVTKPGMVNCHPRYRNNVDSWKNELLLAQIVERYGPVQVMSYIMSFGSGTPNNPSSVCVPRPGGWGHNYVVVGYNLTNSPHTAYWILSDSGKPRPQWNNFCFAKMFLSCDEKHHPGAWGIGRVKASRYCIKGDKRGVCGGRASCRVKANQGPDPLLEMEAEFVTDPYPGGPLSIQI